MQKRIWIFLLAFALLAPCMAHADQMTLTSPQLAPGARLTDAQVFNGFGCAGKNISPELQWKGAPVGTKSFAVTVYDPDAPTGSGWWHWVIFDIPADAKGLKENAGTPEAGLAPTGSVQSRTDFGKPGYGGPCPPGGDKPHHYIFTLFALDTVKLDLTSDAPAAMVGFYLRQHTLAKTGLTGLYSR